MPSVSKSQQRLFQAAEHGAKFPMAEKLRGSMTHSQLHDFSVGSEAGKPQHVPGGGDPQLPNPPQAPALGPITSGSLAGIAPPTPPGGSLLAGDHAAVNVQTLKGRGLSEFDATRNAMALAKPASRHGNLGKFLHNRKDGKPHGSPK